MQNKFNAILNQETTEIKVKFQTGYYPLPGSGGGGGDTSNLVPYTGANKDVDIEAYYFKTSKGFELTRDGANYFGAYNDEDYVSISFCSSDTSVYNLGYSIFDVNPNVGLYFQKSNDIGSNSFQVTTDRTYSLKKFVTEEGYKIINGTANQALTANGGVFDLTTKADLVGGKIPASQLPAYVDDDLSNYYTKSETYSKTEVDDIIADIPGVDTSNLVPYTGANKDVNIASNYFKTSKGFVFTYDKNNYFKTDHSNSYNRLVFYSKDSSTDNFGYMFIEANPEIGFVVNIANGDGIYNYFHATESRTYSEKPFVSSEGFIKTGGTANQALRADGGVFDLSTKADLVGGKVPASQLPAYVDDVLEFANLASFPTSGESGKIYIANDTNLTYRWGGSSYVVTSSSLALGETSSTAYRGDRGKIAYDHSQTTGNPHGTTKSDIGLGNVPNLDTTNAVNNSHTHSNKSILDLITEPFTTSLKSLYDGVVTSINNLLLTGQRLIRSDEISTLSNTSGTNSGDETTSSIQTKRPLKTIEGQSLEGSGNIDLTKSDIGLDNVDNTSDLDKPISTATQTALDAKLSIETTSITGTEVSFTNDRIYGSLASPETANITANTTNAKLGVTNIIIHNSVTAPTFGSQFKKLSGSGNYVTGVVNYIYCTFITATEIIYSINQRS